MTTPDTYSFAGDITTYIGFFGVISTSLIIIIAFRRYWSSPHRR